MNEGSSAGGSVVASLGRAGTMGDVADEWAREAVRLHRRYEREIVHALGLCPWAKRARTDGAIRERVLLQDGPELLEPSLAAVAEMVADTTADVAFFIYPRLGLGRTAFEEFATRVRTADAARHELGGAPFVFAVFHPDAEADMGDPERLIPFVRRTPDPTLQLLRTRVLDRARGGAPQGTQFVDAATVALLEVIESDEVPLREHIARANLATVRRAGVEDVERRFDSIRRDRRAAYQRLADPSPR
jgi:hypothetical protein